MKRPKIKRLLTINRLRLHAGDAPHSLCQFTEGLHRYILLYVLLLQFVVEQMMMHCASSMNGELLVLTHSERVEKHNLKPKNASHEGIINKSIIHPDGMVHCVPRVLCADEIWLQVGRSTRVQCCETWGVILRCSSSRSRCNLCQALLAALPGSIYYCMLHSSRSPCSHIFRQSPLWSASCCII